jgi:hypothetical protein
MFGNKIARPPDQSKKILRLTVGGAQATYNFYFGDESNLGFRDFLLP